MTAQTAQLDNPARDTLFYDGSCPLCSAEICKLSEHTKDNLELVDIHKMEGKNDTPDKEALLSRLHLKTAEGEWLVGIDANIRAWHHTPYSGVWKILGWPVIRLFSSAAYELWLKWRERSSKKGRSEN